MRFVFLVLKVQLRNAQCETFAWKTFLNVLKTHLFRLSIYNNLYIAISVCLCIKRVVLFELESFFNSAFSVNHSC